MNWMVMVIALLLRGQSPSTIESAFTLFENRDWTGAAAALDAAALEDPALYQANNLPYLRGRIAENLRDWARARTEFAKVGMDNPLRPLAMWHVAMNAARSQDPV